MRRPFDQPLRSLLELAWLVDKRAQDDDGVGATLAVARQGRFRAQREREPSSECITSPAVDRPEQALASNRLTTLLQNTQPRYLEQCLAAAPQMMYNPSRQVPSSCIRALRDRML